MYYMKIKRSKFSRIRNESLRHYNRRGINENLDNVVTIGIYGDDVPGFNSVKGIVNYFKSKGIEVYDVEGDMDYGWEMKLKGPGRVIYHAVVPKFPGYDSDSVQEFIDEYEIDG